MSGSFSEVSVGNFGEGNKTLKDEPYLIDVMEDQLSPNDDPDEEEAFWNRQSIYRLPHFVKNRNENIYEPLVVAIGPYHHGKPDLEPMEVHKRRALHHFIRRSDASIQEYRDALMRDFKLFKESYDQLDEKFSTNPHRFIELLMVDGCFILEFMDIVSGTPKDYAPNDPIFSYYGCIIHCSCVMRDLLLLENQLPYLVFETLVSVSEYQIAQPRVQAILSQMMMFRPTTDNPGRHMLDMYMQGLFQGGPSLESEDRTRLSAIQLNLAGIEFNKIDNFSDINFDANKNVLNLPAININDYSISTFMNLKAFELRGTTSRDFNSYIRLMESLIESAKDVKLLETKGIIMNFLHSEESVVKLLKDLSRDTVVDKNCKSYIARQKMTEHYNEMMKQWKNVVKRQVVEWTSNLQQTYFSNPWSIISVVAAACLLVLTVLQTIYTIRTFYTQK